jgi:predicted helicase
MASTQRVMNGYTVLKVRNYLGRCSFSFRHTSTISNARKSRNQNEFPWTEYCILHDPVYRERYGGNLKREFPRIPFYADFWKWAEWGERLIALHIGYERVEPWPLVRIDAPDEKSDKTRLTPKTVLKPEKAAGSIRIDSETELTGIPPEAWNYKLGNRSALEWILDQYKEKTPRDPTIRDKFHTYRFADHKEKVIDLLSRVTRVSVETMKIIEAMKSTRR